MNIFSSANIRYKNINLQLVKNYLLNKKENKDLIIRIFFVSFMYFLNLAIFYHVISIYYLIDTAILGVILGVISFKSYKLVSVGFFIIALTSILHVFINNHNFKPIEHYTYANVIGVVSDIHIKKKISSFTITKVSISPYVKRKKSNKYKKISGKIRVYTNSKQIYSLKNGMKIRITSAIKPYKNMNLPLKKIRIYNGWFQRIYGYSFVSRHIEILNKNKENNDFITTTKYELRNIRISIQNRIMNLFPPKDNPVNSVLLALITGNKGFITEDTYAKFRKAGLSHLLAISGLHIGLVAMSIFLFIRFILIMIPYSHLYINNKAVSAVITLIFTTAYILIIEPAPPMIRSGIIIYILFLSIIFRSVSSSYYVLVTACYIMMIYDPTLVLNVSFQLSFFATFVVLYISTNIYKADVKNYKKIISTIIMISFSSFIINLCIMPISVYHFSNTSLAGFITNPIAMLLMSFVIMPLILISLICYKIFLMKYVLLILTYALKILIWVTNFSFNEHFVFNVNLSSGYVACILTVSILFMLIVKSRIKYLSLVIIFVSLICLMFQKSNNYNLGVTVNGGIFYANENTIFLTAKYKSKKTIKLLEQKLNKPVVFKKWKKYQKILGITIHNHKIIYTRYKRQIKKICKNNNLVIYYGSQNKQSNIIENKNNSCKIINIRYNGSMITTLNNTNKAKVIFLQKLKKYYIKTKTLRLLTSLDEKC